MSMSMSISISIVMFILIFGADIVVAISFNQRCIVPGYSRADSLYFFNFCFRFFLVNRSQTDRGGGP